MFDRIKTPDAVDSLSETRLEAGPKIVIQKPTLYGQYLQLLGEFQPPYWNYDKGHMDTLIQEAQYDETNPVLDDFDFSEDERHYIHLQCIVQQARNGNFAPLILHLSNNDLHATHNIETTDNFHNSPNPLEAESLILEMGKKAFPEILQPSLSNICASWRKLGIGEKLPEEFSDPLQTEVSIRLNALRAMISAVTFQDCGKWYALHAEQKKELAKLVYSMLMMERELSEEVGTDNTQMCLMEKLRAGDIRSLLQQ